MQHTRVRAQHDPGVRASDDNQPRRGWLDGAGTRNRRRNSIWFFGVRRPTARPMSKIHASTEPRQVSGGIVDGPHPGSSRARQPRAEGCAAHLWLLVGMRRWASSICLTTRFHVCGTSFQTRSTVTLGLVVLLGGVVGHGDARPVAVAQNHPVSQPPTS